MHGIGGAWPVDAGIEALVTGLKKKKAGKIPAFLIEKYWLMLLT